MRCAAEQRPGTVRHSPAAPRAVPGGEDPIPSTSHRDGVSATQTTRSARGVVTAPESDLFAGPIGTERALAMALGVEATKQKRRVLFTRADICASDDRSASCQRGPGSGRLLLRRPSA